MATPIIPKHEKTRIFSGIQPSGDLHLGNYLGALRQFVSLQDEDTECLYCIVDLHAITVPQDPAMLHKRILDLAALYIACGLDPKKSILFVQSMVPGHAELNWILTCSSYTGELSRMTQFKSKSQGKESAPAGLFCYPVLMAADILLYDTDEVPVGSDQTQHIELTRDIATRVNNTRGETFLVPKGRYLKEGARIMALDDPTKKMSKSAENAWSRIVLMDDPKTIRKSIMKATTDSEAVVRFDPEAKPGISNLMNIYSVLTGESMADIESAFHGKGYGDFKKEVAQAVIETLDPIRLRFEEIRSSGELEGILRDGAERAGAMSEIVLKRVKERFGLGL